MHLEEQIRNRAYELWTLEGRPGERALDHWFQAAQEFAASAVPAASAGGKARKAASAKSKTANAAPAKKRAA